MHIFLQFVIALSGLYLCAHIIPFFKGVKDFNFIGKICALCGLGLGSYVGLGLIVAPLWNVLF